MTDACRYLVLVSAFSSTVLWLLVAARRADRRERAAVQDRDQARLGGDQAQLRQENAVLRAQRDEARAWVQATQRRLGEPLTLFPEDV